MPSSVNIAAPEKTAARNAVDTLKIWNRKGHYYLGLYFLFFVWLFAFTGLLLNHSWKFAQFWPMRKVSTLERQIVVPAATSDLDQARDLMRQLGITGEIEWSPKPRDPASFEFRVNRPGHNFSVTVLPEQRHAKVEHIELNAWGVMHVLHTFTGVRDDRNERDWILTTVWVFSMDAVSIGLILMVCSGLYLWFGLPAKRNLGAAALALGVVVCGLFVFGLRWIYS